MIPAPFEYRRATDLDQATLLLRELGPEAKVLAGGHSLIPLMRLRLAQPSALVDIGRIPGLTSITVQGDRLHIGALVRHCDLAGSQVVRRALPLLAEMALEVGDLQVRARGTIGGAIAHADSAGDYPTLALMLDAEILTTHGSHPARGFFQHLFTTPLQPDEVVRELVFPVAPGPHRYIKFRRRRCDWAIVGAAAQRLGDSWRLGLTNVGPTPMRAARSEAVLAAGGTVTEAALEAADGLTPPTDIRASADYRRHLARVLTRRALEQAAA
ncbi:MAG TPA: xanthine dehydrogenase family protein subunit M [Verrucomicrobiae bacterium]|nr:xanthine dehydrogenase family protein subunit M [Verrucomicrobiae bacterium]